MSTTDETIQAALQAFKETVSGDLIDSMDSEDLADEAWNVSSFLSADPLPRQWKAINRCYHLYLEVQNGGLHQFFWNQNGEGTDEILDDLHYIGAERYADVFQRARAIYNRTDYPSRSRSQEKSWEAFTEGHQVKSMKVCDQEFYDEYNLRSLPQLIADFIKQHRQLFDPGNV